MPKECCINTWRKIPGDEPVFIIRGKDLLAAKVVRKWITLALGSVNSAKLVGAIEHLRAIEKFQAEHPERCKIPD